MDTQVITLWGGKCLKRVYHPGCLQKSQLLFNKDGSVYSVDSHLDFRHSSIQELLGLLPVSFHDRSIVWKSTALNGPAGPHTSSPNASQTAYTRIMLKALL